MFPILKWEYRPENQNRNNRSGHTLGYRKGDNGEYERKFGYGEEGTKNEIPLQQYRKLYDRWEEILESNKDDKRKEERKITCERIRDYPLRIQSWQGIKNIEIIIRDI